MRSEVLTDDNYRILVARMEGVLEALSIGNDIVAVSITAQGGGLYAYAGVVFFKPKH